MKLYLKTENHNNLGIMKREISGRDLWREGAIKKTGNSEPYESQGSMGRREGSRYQSLQDTINFVMRK